MSLDFLRIVLLVAFAVLPSAAEGQSTDVTCQAQWASLDNSRQQNPCLVAAYLLSPCRSSGSSIPPLSSGDFYSPPTANATTTTCICSTVTYSMLSACALCQSGNWSSWSDYSSTCSIATYNQQYILPIPEDTAVPEWAYLPVETNGFDVQAVTNAISSSSLIDSTGTVMASTSPIVSAASTTTPTITTPLSTSSASSYNTPLISSTSSDINSSSPGLSSTSSSATSTADGSQVTSLGRTETNFSGIVVLIVGTVAVVVPVLGIATWLYLTRNRDPKNKIKDVEILESEFTMATQASLTVVPFGLGAPASISKAAEAEAVPPLPVQKDDVYCPPRYSVCVRGRPTLRFSPRSFRRPP